MREFACWTWRKPTTTTDDACGFCGWPKSHHHDNTRTLVADEFPVPRFAMLDVWVALGGDSIVFEEWIDDHRRTPADAWAQLLAAIEGDAESLAEDTNPPAGELLDLANRDLRLIEAMQNHCQHPAQSTQFVDHKRYGEVCADCLFIAADLLLAIKHPGSF